MSRIIAELFIGRKWGLWKDRKQHERVATTGGIKKDGIFWKQYEGTCLVGDVKSRNERWLYKKEAWNDLKGKW